MSRLSILRAAVPRGIRSYSVARSERSREPGRELKLLHYVYSQPDLDAIRGHPRKVLDLIERFGEEYQYHFMNVGRPKGRIVTDLIAELRPQTMLELGGYVGYSAILFGDAVRRNGGTRYFSLELNPEFAAISNMLVELAGLRDLVRICVGRSDLSLHRLYSSQTVRHVELMFLDHYKPAYTSDLQLCEQYGMVSPGSVLAADNVVRPGNPPYLEYVRSSVEQKRQAAQQKLQLQQGGKNFNTTGFSDRVLASYMGKDSAPAFEVVGNPNLIYRSELVQPEGEDVSYPGPSTFYYWL
ncbi:hypothetical protein ASPZODRAFT_140525 [Penicilliopsis zonata CBS 506.65]|uniref:catechol O-methyltransferase n=1 Tax=Penicilliopsis zonata CBS 506.65 TaxID=1073090 RepID=A0A1L9SLZ3_9EURO|nr:hypothetical protein ASPZODRAFT_140525 [Penicilliopsis zonata CBS 506.65]OJJ48210.1 hypothetical protein ASPZODRAFT_140525 [Penicilliopsis zonata CBS 506.65]